MSIHDEKNPSEHDISLETPDISKDNLRKSITYVSDIFDERYKIFLEQVSDGVFETDIYGSFIYFNNAFCNTLGHSRLEIQGRDFSRFMNSENAIYTDLDYPE
jgi:PAS domain-containing protein